MATGLLEAQKLGPIRIDLPQADPKEADPNTIPYQDFTKRVLGPVDPLVGPTSPDDNAGLAKTMTRIEALLSKNLIAARAIHPNMPIPIIGPAQLAGNTGEKYTFEIGGKKVPALNIFIQNNSSALCYISVDDPYGVQGIQVPNMGGILQIPDVAVHFLGIYVTATTIINGVANASFPSTGFSTTNITVMAWGNAEWTDVWGIAS